MIKMIRMIMMMRKRSFSFSSFSFSSTSSSSSCLSFTKFIIGFSFSFFLFLTSFYYNNYTNDLNGVYKKSISFVGAETVQRNAKIIISDFTEGTPTDIIVEARSNDTLTFKCRMDAGNTKLAEFDEYKTKRFCFPYVLDIYMKVQDILYLIPGSTDLQYKMDEESKIIESEITFPPIIASPVFFRCPCFMKYNERYIEKTLHVHLFPNYPLTFELIGCNFTTIYSHPLGESAFNSLQKLDPIKGQKICSVTINTQEDKYISFLCPRNYELDPSDCIEKHVYIYNKEQDEKKEKIINLKDEAKLVSIHSNFGFKFIEEDVAIDEHTLFGIFDFPGTEPLDDSYHITVHPRGTSIPIKIPEKVRFFCACVKKEHGTITDMLRMNVNFDVTEEMKKIEKAVISKSPVLEKEPEIEQKPKPESGGTSEITPLPYKKKERECLDKLNVCLGGKHKVHPDGGVISPPEEELPEYKHAGIFPPYIYHLTEVPKKEVPEKEEPESDGPYGKERKKISTMSDVLKEYGFNDVEEEGMDIKSLQQQQQQEEEEGRREELEHPDAEEHLKGFKEYNELDLYSVGSSCGILHSAVSLGFVLFVMMLRNESF